MGQYFLIVNTDKKEFLHPHKFGDGLKLMEFGASACGTMTGLALLLRASTEGGGGDFDGDDNGKVLGRWAGDSVVIIGDYNEGDVFGNLYAKAQDNYTDISAEVVTLMKEDSYLRESLEDNPFERKE